MKSPLLVVALVVVEAPGGNEYHWHRVKAEREGTVCGVTPCPTEHSNDEDPR